MFRFISASMNAPRRAIEKPLVMNPRRRIQRQVVGRALLVFLWLLAAICVLTLPSFAQEITSSSSVSYLGATSSTTTNLLPNTGQPGLVALDHQGNLVVADATGGTVKRVPLNGNSPQVLLQGLSSISAIATDNNGNIFVASTALDHVILISRGSNSGMNLGSRLNGARSLTTDQAGDVYIADTGNSRIVEITPGGIQTSTNESAPPTVVFMDSTNDLYVGSAGSVLAYWSNGQVYEVSQGWSSPVAITENGSDNLYVLDAGKGQLIEWEPATKQQVVVQGQGDPRKFTSITGDDHGNLYAFDENHAQVIKVDAQLPLGSAQVGVQTPAQTLTYQFKTRTALSSILLLTQGTVDGQLAHVGGTCITYFTYSAGDTCTVIVAATLTKAGPWNGDVTLISTVVLLDLEVFATGLAPVQALLPGTANTYYTNPYSYDGELIPSSLAVDAADNLYIGDDANARVLKVTPNGTANVLFPQAPRKLNDPLAIAVDGKGIVYIADQSLAWGVSPNLDGPVTIGNSVYQAIPYGQWGYANSFISFMTGLALQPDGGFYFSDSGNNRVVAVDPTNSGVEVLPSSLAIGVEQVPLAYPLALALAPDGTLYIVDYDNDRIVKRSPQGVVSDAVAPGVLLDGESLLAPMGIVLDPAGNLYIADTGNNRIIGLTPGGQSWVILDDSSIIDGNRDTPLNNPQTLAIDSNGNLFVADVGNERILKINRSALSLVFDPTATGLQSPALQATVQNIGNESLNLQSLGVVQPDPDFISGPDATCATQQSLAVNGACILSLLYTPVTAGDSFGIFNIVSNTQNVSGSTISLSLSGSTSLSGPASSNQDHFVISLLPANVTAGVPFSFTLSAQDIQGNLLPGYRGTVKISWSDSIVAPITYTFTNADAGVHTFNGVVLKSAGVDTVTALDTSTASVTTTATTLVYSNFAVAIKLVSGSGQSAVVGQPFSQPLGVELVDAYGNLAAGDAVTFALPASGASAINANGGASPVSTYSDSTGTSYVFLNANSTIGAYKVIASLSSSIHVTFSLTNTGVPPVPVPPPVQGFTLTATPANTTFSASGAASSQVVIVPRNGFSSNVSLSCSAPSGVNCSFAETGSAVSAKAVAVPANSTSPLQLTVQQSGKTASGNIAHFGSVPAAAAMAALFAFLFVPSGGRWKAHIAGMVVLGAGMLCTGLIGCGFHVNNTSQPAEAIQIEVTGTATFANGTLLRKTTTVTVWPYIPRR